MRAKFDPEYTQEAQDAKYEGTVLLSVVIGTDGVAHDINIVKALGMGLDDESRRSRFQKWLFNPGTLRDGEPVQSPERKVEEIHFKLK